MRSRTLLLALLFIVSWIMYLDRAAISTAKDAIAADLSLSEEAMGLAFGAFALGYALAQVPSGWFADKLGPRLALTVVVVGWSVLTAMTGAAWSLWALLTIRFLFGIAEAGAFPGAARVYYSWFRPELHGRANGITFSGSRLGAAFAFPLLAWLIGSFGWRHSFVLLSLPGILWGVVWFAWFRNQPGDYTPPPRPEGQAVSLGAVYRSAPMLLAMGQYFAGNFTFFLCLSWMNPYLVSHYKLSRETAAWYLTVILLIGATAQWVAGWLVDGLHRRGMAAWSRRLPAMTGFTIAAVSLALLPAAGAPIVAVALFSIATFGAELTISPSWAFCIDVGGKNSGAVSGSMNMIGNFGSFVSASIFPVLYRHTGSASAYFYCAAALNLLAVAAWYRMRSPARAMQAASK